MSALIAILIVIGGLAFAVFTVWTWWLLLTFLTAGRRAFRAYLKAEAPAPMVPSPDGYGRVPGNHG